MVLPQYALEVVNRELSQFDKKFGRSLRAEGLQIHSPRAISLEKITLSEPGTMEQEALT